MTPRCRVWRPVEGRIVLAMPYGPDNKQWLKDALGKRIRFAYQGKGKWTVARCHLGTLVEALCDRFGEVHLFLDFRGVERCDARCRNATGRECDCRCLGRHHGQGGITHGWRLVGDTALVMSTGTRRRHIVVRAEPNGDTSEGRRE